MELRCRNDGGKRLDLEKRENEDAASISSQFASPRDQKPELHWQFAISRACKIASRDRQSKPAKSV
jgi:hypothetical protein